MISIVIPSYGRSEKIAAVVQNCRDNTTGYNQILVMVEDEQLEEYSDALHAEFDMPWQWLRLFRNTRARGYSGAVNTAIAQASGDYLFFGSDDLNFHPGWDVEAFHRMVSAPHIKVVGTNDLLNEFVLKGWHSTHHLVDRRYLEDPGGVIDGSPGEALYEGYSHNYCDTEFIGTAKARAVFAPCLSSVVEHLHTTVGKSPVDLTSMKNNLHIQRDHDLYMSRRTLWWDLSR